MKLTRKQLRRLISETIYVDPMGNAYDNTKSDPTDPDVKLSHDRESKVDFLRRQGNEKLRRFAPDKHMHDIGPEDDPDINQGVELANLVGDQGEFQDYLEFSDDEIALKDFADKEYDAGFEELIGSDNFKSDHTSLQGGERIQTNYAGHFDQIEHQMSMRAKKVLKMFPSAGYWDVIDAIQEVPSYERLMNIIADSEGDLSPDMQKLKKLPEKVANQHGVYF